MTTCLIHDTFTYMLVYVMLNLFGGTYLWTTCCYVLLYGKQKNILQLLGNNMTVKE